MAGEPERRIAHLDMDAFYASVELLRHPGLRGRPVAIGGRGDPRSRGVVTTATYEARAFGIHSGMGLRRAAELCPSCVFLPVDFDEYRRYSRLFKQAVAGIAPRIEDRGIDEIYIDLSTVDGVEQARGRVLGERIRSAVREATGGLTCSMGIAPNKLVAKLASELDKPDGLTIVEADEFPRILWPMPARRINGIGPRADERLRALGIETIGQLAAADPEWLLERFGSGFGRWLHDAAHGRDARPIVTHSEPVSRSRETTFERDLHPERDWHEIARVLARLAHQVADELGARGYTGRSVGVKVRFADFRSLTRDLALRAPTNDRVLVRRAAFECLARAPLGQRIRLLGVRIAGLQRTGDATATSDTPADSPGPAAQGSSRSPGRSGVAPPIRDLFD